MGLATVVRLEFAYPGVGVLAGDSLQYLSIATAHGVIMVFFMIMPLIFGAFGNFLLPTQLGVHDVAFPRLNSAAFWFLPGGLIMLCQLVCIDRRYQRMNCFNIRELQGILKRKFFTDLVNVHDFREMLDESMIGLRFKSNATDTVTPNSALFYSYGLNTTTKSKTTELINSYTNYDARVLVSTDSSAYQIMSNFSSFETNSLKSVTFSLTSLVQEFFTVVGTLTYSILAFSPLTMVSSVRASLIANNFAALTNPLALLQTMTAASSDVVRTNSTAFASSRANDTVDSFTEDSTFRFTRFQNPLISYDYKCGNYIGTWDKLYPSLITTYIEVARGIKKPTWTLSEDFANKLSDNLKTFKLNFTANPGLNLADRSQWYSSHVTPMDSFFTTINAATTTNLRALRWVSMNALDQKFQAMFLGASTQQRILANWRDLKFTREAWRCKLLAARHQNTMYRRFLGEDGVVWSIDRNARDLLPG
jgi:hypothetical protein